MKRYSDVKVKDQHAPFDLELSSAAMRRMGRACLNSIVEHISALPHSGCSDLADGRAIAATLREPCPESPTDFNQLLKLLIEDVIPASINTAHPSYMGYIPGGGLFPSAIAELLAAATNRYVSVWAAAPAIARLETNVLEWFAQWIGYPESSCGVLTSGGSMANFTAIVTARKHLLRGDLAIGTMYISDQAHHSVEKAAMLAGIPERNIRKLKSGVNFRAIPQKFEAAIERDVARGLKPFLVVGNAGTTNSGAVDPLTDLADICRKHSLWFHVDAAYGGFFALCAEGKKKLQGLHRSDSVVLDPHKGLFLPYGVGCLLVKRGQLLRNAHLLRGEYHKDLVTPKGEMNFTDYSLEQSRSCRGLAVWLPLKLFGVDSFRKSLAEKLELALWLYQRLAEDPLFECPSQPDLSVITFRYRPRRGDPERLNKRLLKNIIATRNLFLSGTTLRGKYVLRVCILCFRTHRSEVERAFDLIHAEAKKLESG